MNFLGKYLQTDFMLTAEFQAVSYMMNNLDKNPEVVVRPKNRIIISGRKKS